MFQALDDKAFGDAIQKTDNGVVIFHKKLCPHCKNMMKVLEKFHAAKPDVPIFTVDSEENPGSMQSSAIERVPTICIVRKGAVASKKTGLFNPREMTAFYESV